MKKNLIVLCIFCILPVSASTIEPKWSEFCPSEYFNAEYKENVTFAGKHPVVNAFMALTIVGIPFTISSELKSKEIKYNNYWAQRRKSFENAVGMCNSISNNDNKIVCYMNLREQENNKTHQSQLELQRQQNVAVYPIYPNYHPFLPR